MAIGFDPQTGSTKIDEKVSAVMKTLKDADADLDPVKRQWQVAYDMFLHGSPPSRAKQEWQTDFTVNKFGAALRKAGAELYDIMVHNPKWWDLSVRAEADPRARELRKPLKKAMEHYLSDCDFPSFARMFLIAALVSMGTLFIGWRRKLIPNPEYILHVTEQDEQRERIRLSRVSANTEVADESVNELQDELLAALDEFTALAQGEKIIEQPAPKPFLEVGGIELMLPQEVWWDPTFAFLKQSPFKAFAIDLPLYQLKQWAKDGYISDRALKKLREGNRDGRDLINTIKIRGERTPNSRRTDTVEVLFYFGPLIMDDEVKKPNVFYVIGNQNTLLKEVEYPYWEPPGDTSPLVMAVAQKIPYDSAGAGLGDREAIKLQKVYDSNLRLQCDQWRFQVPGINIVDDNTLVDPGQLDEGLYPGMTLHARTDVNKVFRHEALSSTSEGQIAPIQQLIAEGIDEAIGVGGPWAGDPMPKSRTSAAETGAVVSNAERSVNIVALDLEQDFLVPALKKIFARFLQFGIREVVTNPELSALFNDYELQLLTSLTPADRINILQTFYKFEIKGFSVNRDKAQKREDLLSLLDIGTKNQNAGQVLDIAKIVKLLARLNDLEDDDLLQDKLSEYERIVAENTTLLSGHFVDISPNDNHQLHVELQQMPDMNQEQMLHVQAHQMAMQAQPMAATNEQQTGSTPTQ